MCVFKHHSVNNLAPCRVKMVPVTTFPENLLLSVINKMDGNSFTRLRQSNKKLSVFIEASRSRLKVGILGNHQLHLTNNVIDIYRRKRIKMDFWETDASMRSTLIGLRPKRKPIGPRVFEFIQYYSLQSSYIFFHDLELDIIVPTLIQLTPHAIRVSNDKEAYNDTLFNLPQIKDAKRVRFDFFLGLHPITHPLLLQNVHELHIGFTAPAPLTVLRELMINFWNNRTVIDILDLFTFIGETPENAIKFLLQDILHEDWVLLTDFGAEELGQYFPFYASCDQNPHSVAEIMQKETQTIGLLVVSRNKIMFTVKKK